MKKNWVINRSLSVTLGLILALALFFVLNSVFAWTNPTQAPPGGSGILPAQYVTSLPSSPIDGQEVYYVVDSSNKTIWHLRYNAGSSSSYKWEFVGGSDKLVENVTNGQTVFTLPRAGEYVVDIGNYGGSSKSYNESGSYTVAPVSGGTGSVSISMQSGNPYGNSYGSNVMNTGSITATQASVNLRATIYNSQGELPASPWTQSGNWVKIKPKRIQ